MTPDTEHPGANVIVRTEQRLVGVRHRRVYDRGRPVWAHDDGPCDCAPTRRKARKVDAISLPKVA